MYDRLMLATASLIPNKIRRAILREDLIDVATDIQERNPVMEYLFDVYETYIDANGEHNDWNCGRCRAHILAEWKKLKPFLIKLQRDEDVKRSHAS